MKLNSNDQQKIYKAKSYVANGYNISRTFLAVGIIEVILIAIALFSLEVLSFWLILFVVIGVVFTSYVTYIIFGIIISILEQITFNNELLVRVRNDEIDKNEQNQKSVEKSSSTIVNTTKNQSSGALMNEKRLIKFNIANNNLDIFFGRIVQVHSNLSYEFRDSDNKTYVIKTAQDVSDLIGKSIKIVGFIEGVETLRSAVGNIEFEAIIVESIEIEE